jgi:hypothetical protein
LAISQNIEADLASLPMHGELRLFDNTNEYSYKHFWIL